MKIGRTRIEETHKKRKDGRVKETEISSPGKKIQKQEWDETLICYKMFIHYKINTVCLPCVKKMLNTNKYLMFSFTVPIVCAFVRARPNILGYKVI